MAKFREHPLARLSRLESAAAKATRQEHALVKACGRGDAATVRKLLGQGVNPNAIGTVDGEPTPAFWAAVDAGKHGIVEILRKAGADLNDRMNEPAALQAVDRGDLPMLRALAAGGADLNLSDDSGETALSSAIWYGKKDVFDELLRLGAGVDLPLKVTWRAARTPLQLAALANHPEMIEALLAAGATDAKPDALRFTAAAARGDVEALERGLAAGLKVDAKDSLDRTPLVAAAEAGKVRAVKLLLARGAKPNLASGPKYEKRTPLTAAIMGRQAKVVELLLAAGADPTKKDATGLAPLTLAKQVGLKKVIGVLQPAAESAGQPRGTEFRGVPTFDVNDSCVLLEAPVDAVARAMLKVKKLKVHEPDVFGKTVHATGRCYAVMRLHGMPWTSILRVRCQVMDYPDAATARALAKQLKARAIYVGVSDTGGVTQYAAFDDAGRLEECFDYGSTEPGRGVEKNLASLARSFGVAADGLPGVKVGKYYAFGSRTRKLDPDKIANDMEFTNDFIKSRNALAPMYVEGFEHPGGKARFEFLDLAAEDVARMDFVG